VLIHDIDALIIPVLARNIRKINTDHIAKFTNYLSFETWDDVFMDKDVNSVFNGFFNNYLWIFLMLFLWLELPEDLLPSEEGLCSMELYP
jgi:hypothetical protein